MVPKKTGRNLFFILIIFFISNLVWAQDVQIKLEPERPVKESPFKLLFIVDVQVDEVPLINFNPVGVEVLGRQLLGVAKRSSFINGKLSSKTQYTVAYDLVADLTGLARVEDIEIITGGKKIIHKDFNFQILGSNPIANDHFVIALTNKREVFVGESIMLDYYIYTRTQTANHEIRKFPVLKNFIKRFIQKPDVTERVEYNGRVYNRRLLYSVQLFPEKAGDLRIDPLSLRYQFAVVDQNSGAFGNFGFGFRSLKTTTASSDQITIKVNPVPANAPATFVGLVGVHDIQVQLNKTKFIVNDPIELKFEITGKGALENFEAPQFIKSDSIEQFETNGDLKISLDEKATKVFEYTYLPKAPMTLPEREVVMSFLDPESGNFTNKSVRLPAITIGGVADNSMIAPPANSNQANESAGRDATNSMFKPQSQAPVSLQIVAPLEGLNILHKLDKYLVYFLLILVGYIWLLVYRRDFGHMTLKKDHVSLVINKLKKNKKIDYATFRNHFCLLDQRMKNLTFEQYMSEITLSDSNKKYLQVLIDQLESNQFNQSQSSNQSTTIDFNKLAGVFKEVVQNANSKQFTTDFLQ